MLDVLGSDFLRTARPRGSPGARRCFKHGLRTALIPMATCSRSASAARCRRHVHREDLRLVRHGGLAGRLDRSNDTNIAATVTLFVAVFVLFSGWLSDVLYAALDPRVRVS